MILLEKLQNGKLLNVTPTVVVQHRRECSNITCGYVMVWLYTFLQNETEIMITISASDY
jgi:hypothetical protein